ncbi:TetR/AcrR family transcriptional regulator [Lentibacillus cibarius]|uniref:TetR/AcrR family transcriptional regulator n=1 Tax=Lentibacillus cibarius TaxID=2583219 RepID=A0A5S3QGE8_9BACI|nr:TetR/AcrR family transcriptional regulator [Lentibacillus cibarius]TMN20887.1 TetR/AcrR family transcriptional regulator [Lentibacillus cibarius]
MNKKEQQAKNTKKVILRAAEELFSVKGYESVKIRDIAQKAGYSHSTIYVYFKDKEHLLQELTLPPLLRLSKKMEETLQDPYLKPLQKLKGVCKDFVDFALNNRSMYSILITIGAERVDVNPNLEMNVARNLLFKHLETAVKNCLQITDENEKLLCSRIFFFNLHGLIMTYIYKEESIDQLYQRVMPILEKSVAFLIAGMDVGGDQDES